VLVCLSNAAIAEAECVFSRYAIAQDFVDSKLGTGTVSLSLRPNEVTVKNLLCVSETLKNEHPEWIDVDVFIFSSVKAAQLFNPVGPDEHGDYRRDLRAWYSLTSNEASLTITPIGIAPIAISITPRGDTLGEGVYYTKIDLPLTNGEPHCRLEIIDRCLLALEAVAYPKEALTNRVSGKVTLIGTVDREGKVTAAVGSVDGRQSTENPLLVRAALDNISTWWVEPAERQDTFQITFSYSIDAALQRGKLDVNFDLPNQISIRANP
jgi:TonB family protein